MIYCIGFNGGILIKFVKFLTFIVFILFFLSLVNATEINESTQLSTGNSLFTHKNVNNIISDQDNKIYSENDISELTDIGMQNKKNNVVVNDSINNFQKKEDTLTKKNNVLIKSENSTLDNEIINICSDLKNYYQTDVNNEVTLYIKNDDDEILNKSGYITFNFSYPDANYKSVELKTVTIGKYEVKNGICKINFTINEKDYDWDRDYYPWLTFFNFVYHDINNNEYNYSSYVNIILKDDIQFLHTIYGNSINCYAGQNITFKGYVTDELYIPINNGRVIIKLNGKTIKSDLRPDTSNSFEYTYNIPNNFSAKNYTITYVYTENNNLIRSENKAILTVMPKPTKIIADNLRVFAGQTINITGSVLDINNNSIKDGRIVLKLNGKTFNSNITLKNSKFSYTFTVPGYQAKNYIITYVYVGNKNYQRSELNKTFTIESQESIITSKNITGYKNQSIKLIVNIRGKKTNIVAVKGTVGFKLNGKTVKLNGKPFIQNITNGTVIFNYVIPETLKAKNYQITVTYSGGRYLSGNKVNTSILTVKD